MSVLQYSPHPAAFYTLLAHGERVGLGAGACANNPGLWNIVWLACPQADEHLSENPAPNKIAVWAPEFAKPFTDTAAHLVSGTAIGDLATMLHAKGFVQYLLAHPHTKTIPLVVRFGAGILVTMRNRAEKAANVMSGDVVGPPNPMFEPADKDRTEIESMGDRGAEPGKGGAPLMLAPYDLVKSKFAIPPGIQDRGWQIDAINETAVKERAGLFAEVGTGKTFLSTFNALYKLILEGRTTIVAMPPILIPGWLRWLAKIQGITVCDYRGPPKERKAHNLNANFILMSMQIFKNDYDHILNQLGGKKLTLIVDEATSIKNIESGNYRYTKQTVDDEDCHLQLLTGTPLNTPGDAYAYIKLVAPRIYLNHNQFKLLHVMKRDSFDNVEEWTNLSLLKENMKVNSIRLLRNDVLKIAEPILDPVHYDLEQNHYAMYRALCDEQLKLIPNKELIDGITAAKIRSRAQQLIWNFPHFSNQPDAKSSPYELLDEIINQLGCHDTGGRKLIIFGNFRMTMAAIEKHLGQDYIGVINGDKTSKQKELYIQSFIADPRWNILLIHPDSGGTGLDGLQHVCSDAIFVETPKNSIGFQQCVGRISRDGQIGTAQIRVAIANRTVQVSLHANLLTKEETAGYVQGNYRSLRAQLYGEEL